MSINLKALRRANIARIPRFKNKLGERVHNDDGSDWSLEQWFAAMMGELGEVIDADLKLAAQWTRFIPDGSALDELAKEIADVVVYLDILAYQWRVELTGNRDSNTGTFVGALRAFVHAQGIYANRVKKMRRGEPGFSVDDLREIVANDFGAMLGALESMARARGIDLGKAVEDKFNEVSDRVSAGVFLAGDSVEILPEPDPGPLVVKVPLDDLAEDCTDDGRRIKLIEEVFSHQSRWHTWFGRVVKHPDHGLLRYTVGFHSGDEGEDDWGADHDDLVECTRARVVQETVRQTVYKPIR